MNLNKYRNLLLTKMKAQMVSWFEADEKKSISNSEVYSFLHSIKGTSGTLELGGIYQLVGKLMLQVEEKKEKTWKRNELKLFLTELISLTYDYEHFKDAEETKNQPRDEKIPLIQIIDDDITLLILLKDFLEKKGWMVITNSTPENAISQYFDFNPDCVIIDVNLPNKNGFEVIQDIQKNSSKQFIPIIMMSILNDKKTRIQAFKMGADDFLEKPLDLEELTVRIDHHLQRKQMYDQSVLLDELTKLYNRRYLKVAFNRNMNELSRNGEPFSLAILDLDYFKKVNDSYGHLTGDKVLSGFAEFLVENTRNSDIVFRYGGEEFVILFQNTDHHQASKLLSRLLDGFSKQRFEAKGQCFSITFSAGIHTITIPETTMEAALTIADQALYKAKELGRARVEYINKPLAKSEQRKLFISIIDDDPIIRMMIMKNLQEIEIDDYKINIQAFEDGLTFFNSSRLSQHGEHFLILDGIMPVMDGLEILKKVKQTNYSNHILVMMLTGRNSKADIAKALELGADDYMTKPFNMENFQSRIKQLIHRINN
jgi:two-component system, cell cycle response regulator